jgi:hypothetical protein
VKGLQNCSKKGLDSLQRGDNYQKKKVSLLKAMCDKHRSKSVSLSPVMVTAVGYLKNCSDGYKQTNQKTWCRIIEKSSKEPLSHKSSDLHESFLI